MSIIEKAAAAAKLEKEAIKPDRELLDNNTNIIEKSVKSLKIKAKEEFPATGKVTTDTASRLKPKRVALNFEELRHHGIITPDDRKNTLTEKFRIIKRPLLMNSFKTGAEKIKNGNLIMMTSSLAGEGKSFCAVNLAMSIAMEMDHTVLLVDADVSRPIIPKILGLGEDKGLLDVLLDDKLDLTEVLIRTSIEKLSVLTAGTPHPNANELLASQSMGILLKELAHRYEDRIIIFDSPPLLQTSEARVLAAQMGQIVLVVEDTHI